MFNYHEIEFLANERQHSALARAEAQRLLNQCTTRQPTFLQHIRGWLGIRFVQWGSLLQGQITPTPSYPDPQSVY